MIKYNIYDVYNKCCYKEGCTLKTVLPPGYALSDDEVRDYFHISEDNDYWDRAHTPYRLVSRYVFDKCIIPVNGRFRLEACNDTLVD